MKILTFIVAFFAPGAHLLVGSALGFVAGTISASFTICHACLFFETCAMSTHFTILAVSRKQCAARTLICLCTTVIKGIDSSNAESIQIDEVSHLVYSVINTYVTFVFLHFRRSTWKTRILMIV